MPQYYKKNKKLPSVSDLKEPEKEQKNPNLCQISQDELKRKKAPD